MSEQEDQEHVRPLRKRSDGLVPARFGQKSQKHELLNTLSALQSIIRDYDC